MKSTDNKSNADLVLSAALQAGITSNKELANFMAQTGHESGGFGTNVKNLTENMNYSASRLTAVFGKRNGLTPELASTLNSQGAEAIANHVYGGEWGRKNLGNTEPGDGWQFRGRGFIQITGRDCYERAGKALGLDLINNPDLAAQPEHAAQIAVWYWNDRVKGTAKEDVTAATKAINGGYNGLDDRKQRATEWTKTLDNGYIDKNLSDAQKQPGTTQPSTPTESIDTSKVYRVGSKGTDVQKLQEQLNQLGIRDARGRVLNADGDFGANTKAAVEAFQKQQGLKADGIAGPATLGKLQEALQQQHDNPTKQPTLNGEASQVADHERILVSAIAGFDLGTGNSRTTNSNKVQNPNAAYEYGMDGRDRGNVDKDQFKEIDCSGLVYHALRNAGYRVDEKYPNMNGNQAGNFTTKTLFNGSNLTNYAKQNFDKIPEKDVQPGDLIMFGPSKSGYQHIGIVAEVKDGRAVSYYGSQSSTGPAVTTSIPSSTLVGFLRPKDSFYDPSRDLTKTVPEGFNKRYEQIKNQEITPKTNPGKPGYPLLNDKNSWANVKTNERNPQATALFPTVQALKDRLESTLGQQIKQFGVAEKPAGAMLASTVSACAAKSMWANDIGKTLINPEQNRLLVLSANNSNMFVSLDAKAASRANPNEQYAQANQLHLEQSTKQTQENQQQQNLQQQHHEATLVR